MYKITFIPAKKCMYGTGNIKGSFTKEFENLSDIAKYLSIGSKNLKSKKNRKSSYRLPVYMVNAKEELGNRNFSILCKKLNSMNT